jgi:hypothetical protein
MPSRGPWIFLIQRPIGQPIEKHGGGACQDHAGKDKKRCPQRWVSICRDQKRPQGKGKSEDRVRKTDQLKKARDDIRVRRIFVLDNHD